MPHDCRQVDTDNSKLFVQELTRAQFDLHAYIRMLYGQQQDTDDILQETNLALWEKRHLFDPARPFLPWARAFALNQVRAWRQKIARDRLVFDEETLEVVARRLCNERYGITAALARVEECIERLPPRQKTFLEQRYIAGDSLSEIARRFKCTLNAVSITLSRMRKALAECLEHLDDGAITGEQ